MTGQRRAVSTAASRIGRHRRLATAVAVVGVLALTTGVVAPTIFGGGGPLRTDRAQASDAAASLVSMINSARSSQGLAPLSTASDLTAVAAQRAQIMASSGSLSHTPDLGGQVCCWTWLGENAAYAGSVGSLHSVLMGSAPHRANILNSDADDVGVAVVRADGQLWAAQVFRARSDGGSSGGGRVDDASGASRSGERSSPTTTVAPSPDGIVVNSGPTPAQIRRAELRERLHSLRADLRKDRQRHGPFDPLRAAVRYAGTLDRVSR